MKISRFIGSWLPMITLGLLLGLTVACTNDSDADKPASSTPSPAGISEDLLTAIASVDDLPPQVLFDAPCAPEGAERGTTYNTTSGGVGPAGGLSVTQYTMVCGADGNTALRKEGLVTQMGAGPNTSVICKRADPADLWLCWNPVNISQLNEDISTPPWEGDFGECPADVSVIDVIGGLEPLCNIMPELADLPDFPQDP